MNRIHERALRIAYKDNVSTFEELLGMDNKVTVHQWNLQSPMVEIYKIKYNPNPSFMKQIFEEKEMPHNLRYSDRLQLPKAETTCHGIDIVRSDLWEKNGRHFCNLDEIISFGEIAHHLDPEIRKLLINGIFGNQDFPFHFGP